MSVVMKLVKAIHTRQWDADSLRIFRMLELCPEMLDALTYSWNAMSRHRLRPKEIHNMASHVGQLLDVLTEHQSIDVDRASIRIVPDKRAAPKQYPQPLVMACDLPQIAWPEPAA